MKIEYKIAKACKDACRLEGVSFTADFKDAIGIESRYLDNYLALGTLADLLRENKAELIFKVDKEDKKMKYLLKLLKEEEK